LIYGQAQTYEELQEKVGQMTGIPLSEVKESVSELLKEYVLLSNVLHQPII
jgi:hypothetical protein